MSGREAAALMPCPLAPSLRNGIRKRSRRPPSVDQGTSVAGKQHDTSTNQPTNPGGGCT